MTDLTDQVEFSQARAWLHAIGAADVDAREQALADAETNHYFAATETSNDWGWRLSPDGYDYWVGEEARHAGEVERLRAEMVALWRNRGAVDWDLTPEIQRYAEVQQAKAWLYETDRAVFEQWQSARQHAVNEAEETSDDDRIVALWHAATRAENVSPVDRVAFDSAVDEAQETRAGRVQQAQAWLASTDPARFSTYKQNRAMADFESDAVGDDRRLVQRWLNETSGELTPEQLRAEAAALSQAEQSLRQRMTQRVRGWVSSEPAAPQSTRERGTGLEL